METIGLATSVSIWCQLVMLSGSPPSLHNGLTERAFTKWPHQIFSFNLFGVKLRQRYFLKALQAILICSQVWSRKGGAKRCIYWDKAEDLWDKDHKLCNPSDWVLILDVTRSVLLDLRLWPSRSKFQSNSFLISKWRW